jgi:hypothetical protein
MLLRNGFWDFLAIFSTNFIYSVLLVEGDIVLSDNH